MKKEFDDDGAINNIITVIQKDPTTQHLDFQGRIDHAGELFQVALDRFNACRCTLPGFGNEETDRQVAAFADGLVDWVSGNIEWSIINHRYNVFMNEDDRRDNILRLKDLRLDDRRFTSRRYKEVLLLFCMSIMISIYVLYSMTSM